MSTDFEPSALREKYRHERDKRLRGDGNEQYVEMTGQFAHYLDDPYVVVEERPHCTTRSRSRSSGAASAACWSAAACARRASKTCV